MEYKIRKESLRTVFRDVREAKSEPYWISDAKDAMFPGPITMLHYHNMMEFGLCICGSGEYQIEDKLYRFGAGDMAIIDKYVPHYSNSDENAPALWKVFFFDPVRLMQLAGMLDPEKTLLIANTKLPFNMCFSKEDNAHLSNFINKIISLSEIQDEYTDASLAFAISSFLIECARYGKKHISNHHAEGENKMTYYRIAPAVDIINARIENNDLLKESVLAKRCNMSVANFRREFTKYTGLSPKKYINQNRMAYAQYLLRNTELTVMEIASKVGYTEISSFNRMFKNTFSISPKKYRSK